LIYFRWAEIRQIKMNNYVIYYKGLDDTYQFGFAIHKNLLSSIREFNPIFERVCTKKLNTKPINIFIINMYAPTENKDETDKDKFYEELTRI